MADVRFESIGRCWNRMIFEVRKGMARGFEEPIQCLKLNRIDLEKIFPSKSYDMVKAQVERRGRRCEEELAISMDEKLLGVFRMPFLVLQFELQPHAQVTEKMHMATLNPCAVFLKDLPQTG